ncbi:unnamed protein product [Symbiodinium necroappetens]|uniref:Uncharacterized protein n=1 Tax=Symbiodinium necroappetens TaxID=1628268 RepID=A0A812SUS6_9DINO|nr:unnamed protein product [Symbiodinium necroappetens]
MIHSCPPLPRTSNFGSESPCPLWTMWMRRCWMSRRRSTTASGSPRGTSSSSSERVRWVRWAPSRPSFSPWSA